MNIQEVGNIELKLLEREDYPELKDAMIEAYQMMPDAYWKQEQINALIKKFPEGQVIITVNNKLAGCALSIVVSEAFVQETHTYREITKNYTFNSHNPKGNMLYGLEVFIKPEFRGLRLGRRLYDYRKELCENLNLKGIVFGGRIPGYHNYQDELTPKEYIERVKRKEIADPVLNFQIS